jgi:lipid-binding SYLF domain-containing protein
MKNLFAATALALTLAFTGCQTAPQTEEGKADIRTQSANALAKAEANDPSLAAVLNSAKAYAVFPYVGKGGFVAGGAYGKGCLYENGMFTGYTDMTQASIGLQAGVQAYTEIVVFNTQDALSSFKAGHLQFDAQATAVAIKSGSGANAKFRNGVAVFTMDEGGLMFEASIGGQRFTYDGR